MRELLIGLLALGFREIPAFRNDLAANEACVNVNSDTICYFRGSEKPVEWNNARKLCKSLNSTLPVIRNKKDQDALSSYLKSRMDNSVVWTAGESFTCRDWAWINEESLEEFVQVEVIGEEQDEKDHAAIESNLKFSAQCPHEKLFFICQYEGAFCNQSGTIIVNKKCLKLLNETRKWYDARNQCLKTGGDLAGIDDDAYELLKSLTFNQKYWVGLKRRSWRWAGNNFVCMANSNDEIKFTNWDINIFSMLGQCITIDASDGKWKAIGCDQLIEVVCQRSNCSNCQFPVRSQAVSEESANVRLQSSTPQSLCMNTTISNLCSSSVGNEFLSLSYSAFICAVVVGIFFILISNVIVALAVRKFVCQSSKVIKNGCKCSEKLTDDKTRYQDLEMTRSLANPNDVYAELLHLQPDYEEV